MGYIMGYKSSLLALFSGMILVGINSPSALAEVICEPQNYSIGEIPFPQELCPRKDSEVVQHDTHPTIKDKSLNRVELTWQLIPDLGSGHTRSIVGFYKTQLSGWKVESISNNSLEATKDGLQAKVTTDSPDNPTTLTIAVDRVPAQSRSGGSDAAEQLNNSSTEEAQPSDDLLSLPMIVGGSFALILFIWNIVLTMLILGHRKLISVNRQKLHKQQEQILRKLPQNSFADNLNSQMIDLKKRIDNLEKEVAASPPIPQTRSQISCLESSSSLEPYNHPTSSCNSSASSSSSSSAPPPSESWQHIIDAYENNPDSLREGACKVSETTSSVRRRNENPDCTDVTLAQQNNYSYLIIKDARNDKYWLMPKPNLNPMQPGKSSTFQKLFNISGFVQPGRPYRVLKPAQVEMSGNEWELVQPGEVEFS